MKDGLTSVYIGDDIDLGRGSFAGAYKDDIGRLAARSAELILILGHQANIRTVGQHGVERYEIGRVCRAATGR